MTSRHLAWFFPAVFLLPHAVLFAGFFEDYQENFFGVSSLKDALEVTYYIVTVYAAFYAVMSYQEWKESHQSLWDKEFLQSISEEIKSLGDISLKLLFSVHDLEIYVTNCKSSTISGEEFQDMPELDLDKFSCLASIDLVGQSKFNSVSIHFRKKLQAVEETAMKANRELNDAYKFLKDNDLHNTENLELVATKLQCAFDSAAAFNSALVAIRDYDVIYKR